VLPTDAQWTGGIVLGGDRAAQAAAQPAATADVTAFLSGVIGGRWPLSIVRMTASISAGVSVWIH
jgi:hypothetical protein